MTFMKVEQFDYRARKKEQISQTFEKDTARYLMSEFVACYLAHSREVRYEHYYFVR